MEDNKVMQEIKKVIGENLPLIISNDDIEECAKNIYSLVEEVSIDFYNQMTIDKEEGADLNRFDGFAKRVYGKV